MSEHKGTVTVLIGVMTIAMIVTGILVVSLIIHKVSLVPGTVSQTQNILPIDVRGVLGTVEKISGQEITLKDFRKSMTATSSPVSQSARMTVLVDQSTVIQRLVYKDATTIAKESADFYKNIQKIQTQNSPTPPRPPEPFSLEKIVLGDIHIGDVLTAYSGEDISELMTFTATKIEVRN